MKHFHMASALGAMALCALLLGCGGGGGSSGTTVRGGSGSGGTGSLTWTSGSYADASTYKDYCEAPRSGTDIEGNAFPDQQGSLLYENFWLRSWTHETYLWNDEVVDENPANYSSRTDYFDVLRTTAITASGEDKDNFHFSEPTEEYLARRNSAGSAGYGARFIGLSTTAPRDYRVGYVDAGTPATAMIGGVQALTRGTKILEVDGVDLINATSDADIDVLNAGLFPDEAGVAHTFVVQDDGATTTRTITLTPEALAQDPVHSYSVVDTGAGKVGYILFNTFSPYAAEAEIASAMSYMAFQNVSDLVIDLRYNGGGLLAIASQLSYMVAGPNPTNNQTFELLQFNDDAGSRNPVTGAQNDPIPFYDTGLGFSLPSGASLTTLDLNRVFILTTERTCSASEAVINGLRGVDIEVILIGDTTCGKPYGFYPQDNCGETYYTIQFQGVNDKGFGDYADGFTPINSNDVFAVTAPGCAVADDFSHGLGNENEELFAAALSYRETGVCPATVRPAPAAKAATSTALIDSPSVEPPEDMLGNNRDMTMPEEK